MSRRIQTKLSESTLNAWVNALKSGTYKPGNAHLGIVEDGVNRHCALGVLCEILGTPKKIGINGTYFYGTQEEVSDSGFLPHSVREATGISKRGVLAFAIRFGNSNLHDIISLNDNNMPVDQIAQIIEEQFLPADVS